MVGGVQSRVQIMVSHAIKRRGGAAGWRACWPKGKETNRFDCGLASQARARGMGGGGGSPGGRLWGKRGRRSAVEDCDSRPARAPRSDLGADKELGAVATVGYPLPHRETDPWLGTCGRGQTEGGGSVSTVVCAKRSNDDADATTFQKKQQNP